MEYPVDHRIGKKQYEPHLPRPVRRMYLAPTEIETCNGEEGGNQDEQNYPGELLGRVFR